MKKYPNVFPKTFVGFLILFCTFIPQSVNTINCSNGCLRCSVDDICLLCDSSQFYTRSGFKCIQKIIPNCSKSLDGITCYKCKLDFFFNPITNNCTAIEQKRTNCLTYNQNQACVQCNPDYYVSQTTGNCVFTRTPIANCNILATESTCSICGLGYYLGPDALKCLALNQISNCRIYSNFLSCVSCKNNYYFFRNKYLIDLRQSYSFLNNFHRMMMTSVIDGKTILDAVADVCIAKVTNCATISSKNTCTFCQNGFFIADGRCIKNPDQTIQNCEIYSSSQTCSKCKQRFYLNQALCLPITEINFCDVYATDSVSTCLKCIENFYVLNSVCILRKIVIDNCVLYKPNDDSCQTCNSGFIMLPDFLACLPQIQYCSSTGFIKNESGIFYAICLACINQFYISTTTQSNGDLLTNCLLPSQLIVGCLKYKSDTLCSQCIDGYYLANFRCVQQSGTIKSMILCDKLSVTQPNICSSCLSGQFMYRLLNYCNPVTDVQILPNCVSYGTNGECSKCISTFYLTSSGAGQQCVKTNIINCVIVDDFNNICLECDPQTGTIPNNGNKNNMCTSIPGNFNLNCYFFALDIKNHIANCQSCFAPYYSLLMNSVYFQFCYPYSEIQNIGKGITSSDLALLSSCLSFDLNERSCLFCDPSSITPIISSSSPALCVQLCAWGDEVILTFSINGIYPDSIFKCVQVTKIHMYKDSSTNCQRADYDMSVIVTEPSELKINQLCATCLPNNIPVVLKYSNNFYSHYDYLPMVNFNNKLSALSFFSPLIKKTIYESCKNWNPIFMTSNSIPFVSSPPIRDSNMNVLGSYTANSIYFVLNWQNFINCDALIAEVQDNGFNLYGCSSCDFSYTGAVLPSIKGTNFVYSCKKMPDCNILTYYAGIGSHDTNAQMDLFVSCHACNDPTKIITITGGKPWSMPDSDKYDSQPLNYNFEKTGYGFLNSCQTPGLISKNVLNFPKNCAIQQIIPSQKFKEYTTTLSIPPNPACVACLPMFYPILSTTILENEAYKFIVFCNQIQNCLGSSTFNACDNCINGYVLEADTKVAGYSLYGSCVVNNVENCFIGFKNSYCVVCVTGYVLNKFGFCDNIIMSKCNQFGNMTPYSTAYNYLTFNPFLQGCVVCQTGSYSVRFPDPVSLCVNGTATINTVLKPNAFINNCLYYGMNGNSIICITCGTGYTLTDNKNNCIKLNLIENCIIYSSTANNDVSPVCYTCTDTYFLYQNACIKGTIKGCLVYIDQFNCQQCQLGLMATNIFYKRYTICFDISLSLSNCNTFDISLGFLGYLECSKCVGNNYIVPFGVPITTCSIYPVFEKCTSYMFSDNFLTSNFICVQCDIPYYIIEASKSFQSICQLRINFPINNCLTYSIKNDICSQCIVGYFLSANNAQCIQNPNGIQGCRIYFESINNCQECDGTALYYPRNGKCITLGSTATVVDNCYTYSNVTACISCKPGYVLQENKCELNPISNCQIPGFNGVCTQCNDGYWFIGKSCQLVDDKSCIVFDTPQKCSQCANGYFVNNGKCTSNNDAIPNCKTYGNAKSCLVCNDGMILNNGNCIQLNANQTALANAQCGQYEMSAICSYCEIGYYFDSNSYACLSCADFTKCAFCDFNDPKICLICKSGYYMNSNQTCQIVITVNTTEVAFDDANNDFYKISKEWKIGVVLIWFLALI